MFNMWMLFTKNNNSPNQILFHFQIPTANFFVNAGCCSFSHQSSFLPRQACLQALCKALGMLFNNCHLCKTRFYIFPHNSFPQLTFTRSPSSYFLQMFPIFHISHSLFHYILLSHISQIISSPPSHKFLSHLHNSPSIFPILRGVFFFFFLSNNYNRKNEHLSGDYRW